ncbi:MAG TPA: hypothetical protein GXX63_09405 [Tissierellia bacterium]|nr:hypothetical protein [Tissierellia bacterium]
MSSKRYYWLKLNENFFEREEIKVIESMPNGKDYIIFYMKLLLKSIRTEGQLKFREVIPYTPDMLAAITNTSVDTVRVAIDMFSKLDLMEVWDDGTLFMVETQNMIGSETDSARRMRRLREKEKQKELPASQSDENKEQCDVDVIKSDTDIEIDIDKELDIDKDIEEDIDKEESSSTLTKENINLIIETWNKLNLQQLKAINSNTKRYSMLKARINEYSLEEVIQAIESIDKSDFLKGQNKRGWTITFDWFIRPNNFLKVSEGNYIDGKSDNKKIINKKNVPMKQTRFHNFEQRTDKYSEDALESIVERKREEYLRKLREKK